MTNAVKHFKFRPRGKRRLHQRPNAGEVDHCRRWLDLEIGLVRPRLIPALGATATRSLFGKEFKIREARKQTHHHLSGAAVQVTVHPSYLLRLNEDAMRGTEYGRFVSDILAAKRLLKRL